MKILTKLSALIAAAAILHLAGCASSPRIAYAKAHPELAPAHRQILLSGKIPGGMAAEGMTKEQVKLAVGSPKRLEQAGTGDVWVYVHERFLDISPADASGAAYGTGPNAQRNFTETANLGPRPSVRETARVFFRGDRATHVQIGRE